MHNVTFDAYLDSMSKDGTYGDNLTLIALMREYNLQCLVVSSRGFDQSALVSTDGSFDNLKNVGTIALGYFPEGFGMHYVSIKMDKMVSDQLISTLECTYDADNSSETKTGSASEHRTGQVRDADESIITRTTTENTVLKDLRNMINSIRAQRRKTTFPFLLLPLHIQIDILKICINSNPVMQFVIAKVGEHLRELIRLMAILKPRIYIAPYIQLNNRNPVSVRFLLMRAGGNSGLILAIKQIIKDRRWANAWLRLRMSGIHWYDIIDVEYLRQ